MRALGSLLQQVALGGSVLKGRASETIWNSFSGHPGGFS